MTSNETIQEIAEIEKMHSHILAMVDGIILSSKEIHNVKDIDKEVRHLCGYVMDTFKKEENLMIKHKYTNYDSHTGSHLKFLKNFAILKRLFEEEGSLDQLSVAIKNQVVEWLVNHLTNEDKDMITSFKNR